MNGFSIDDSLSLLVQRLEDEGVWYKEDHCLKYETYFKMGGLARVFLCPQSIEHFVKAVTLLRGLGLEFKVIGLTSNVLLFDEITYSVILSTRNLQNVEVGGGRAYVDCGYSLQDFVRIAVTNGSSGFEGLEGIPGSVGGGIFMNAGAYGFTISDKLISVRCLTSDNEIVEKSVAECRFTHRNSIFKSSEFIILGATFSFQDGNREEIAKAVETYHIARHSYQEFVYPNLGSLYSVTGRVYEELFRGSRKYSLLHALLKLALKNPVSKFVSRKRPSNAVFNKLFENYRGDLPISPSPKSINILINDGEHSAKDVYQYVKTLRDILSADIRVENEFVVEPCCSMEDGFEDLFEKFKRGFG
jgi:UDP-N-acetylmuramate dehydrogenase